MNGAPPDVGTRAHVRLLRARGFGVCKPDPREKMPTYEGWSARSLEADDFADGEQLGLMAGALSDGNRPGHSLVTLDLDSDRAVQLADKYLPRTSLAEGRPGKVRSHRSFLVPNSSIPDWARSTAQQAARAAEAKAGHPGPFTKSFPHHETGKEAIRFVGTGGQTVCPPSTHPSGEIREWDGGEPGDPVVFNFRDLWDAVCELASACDCRLPSVGPRPNRPAGGSSGATGVDLITRRVLPWLAKCDPAVSGQGGHGKTLKVARGLVRGFLLDADLALDLLLQHYNPRCAPEWSEGDLRHKVADAEQCAFGLPDGYLLNAQRPERASRTRSNFTGATRTERPTDNGGVPAAEPSPATETFPRPGVGEEWNDPHRLARLFLDRYRHADRATLVQWRDQYHRWEQGAWVPVSDADLDAELARHCREVFQADFPVRIAEAQRAAESEGRERPQKPPKVYPVTTATRANVRVNLAGLANVSDDGRAIPFWLDGRDGPVPTAVISAPNGLFRLGDIAAGGRAFSEPTPQLFTPNALSFDVSSSAGQPGEWLRRLEEWFNGDKNSIAGLQEWFGYFLSAETRAQKALLLVGPPRSGKGTIMHVLAELVGHSNVASTSFASLGESFGLEDLLGKRLALIPDARLSGRTDVASVVERLLSISGEDLQSVNRKNRPRLTARVYTRFLIATNVMPQLPDASDAIASRFHILNTPNSWLGREDPALKTKLQGELPAILKWAAEGWARLNRQNMIFTPNQVAERFSRELRDLSNPVMAFVRQRCYVGPDYSTDVSEIYGAWVTWNRERGREHVPDQSIFGRDLNATLPHLRVGQRRDLARRVRVYRGISVREEAAWGDDDASDAA
ncbi:Phage/plasmid primase, P4 family, C-terminal domain protein OS=Singulisphaera acidiphila (strain ATCC BAA-1392 / DSM 18658 / VKM B-2454 / MOB10) GN=Sinac_4213 PE=4 SV=1 [Gemmata massiliana]|uniref:Phage/plasmid primase, P4 family, C-terminal domain protein n=1 Tax=Gemmata massiliana TaxID=1210884 RepID=A0A6P2D9G2_9BACT|nr:phage/plasmid primase, P4 family [Gemmata massiliana]VTR97819.1 Phage/plasmid primase, P4 family, C-terminal domain protein OS=Singulisphaera acidiphila (strain ATCC BAA-1392 / DSM 18658 / VKM B-2454 / MOB10) GN=Sinac_4213 PE=4 SV=1 [Gemmata massiliana]